MVKVLRGQGVIPEKREAERFTDSLGQKGENRLFFLEKIGILIRKGSLWPEMAGKSGKSPGDPAAF